MKRLIGIILLISLPYFGVEAKSVANKGIQQLMENSIESGGAGMAVIAIHKGKTVFLGARGMANIELSVKLSPQSAFRIGSITKQFTTAAILLLEEQGKLAIDDPLSKYIDDFPTDNKIVTISQLMSHTSGINNYTNNQETMEKRIQTPVELDDMLTLFAKEPMLFSPGESMQYSNTGYILLGKIIEIVSGQSYKDFIEQRFFKKLNMANSYYGGRQIIKNRAAGYTQSNDGVVNASLIDMSWPHAAGAIVSTVEDLAIWNLALRSGQVVSSNNYLRMSSPTKLLDGSEVPYGFGLSGSKLNKYSSIGHGGGIPGFSTASDYYPTEDLFIATFANSDRLDPDTLSVKIAAKILDINYPKLESTDLPNKTFEKYLGDYHVSKDSVRTLLLDDGVFYTQRDSGRKFEVQPVSANTFFYPGSLTYFVLEKNDRDLMEMKFYARLSEQPAVATRKNSSE
jgi:CubicO group peptidase (beta-lactamase class C family)